MVSMRNKKKLLSNTCTPTYLELCACSELKEKFECIKCVMEDQQWVKNFSP